VFGGDYKVALQANVVSDRWSVIGIVSLGAAELWAWSVFSGRCNCSPLDPLPRDDRVVRNKKSITRVKTDWKARLAGVQQAVRDLRALQQEIGKRNGFKPITDKEIKDAVNWGRP
jgi:hypothetical protein